MFLKGKLRCKEEINKLSVDEKVCNVGFCQWNFVEKESEYKPNDIKVEVGSQ